MSICNPQCALKHGPQTDVVAFIKKLDCSSKLATEVRVSISERRLHQADIFAVYGESGTVMEVFSLGIVLKKRLGVDVIIPIPWYNQSTIFMSEPPQGSVWLKLGNVCQNENIQYAKLYFYIYLLLIQKNE